MSNSRNSFSPHYKHLEVLQKYYSAACHIFNSLLNVWKCGKTRYLVFDITYVQSNVCPRPILPMNFSRNFPCFIQRLALQWSAPVNASDVASIFIVIENGNSNYTFVPEKNIWIVKVSTC